MTPRTLFLVGIALLLSPILLSSQAATPSLSTTFRAMGDDTFEPTLGANAAGDIFYSMTPVDGVAIGYGTGVWKSTNGGVSWTDVSPKIAGIRMPPETNDPYVYVDPITGRVFQFAMFPILACSIMSWSDNGGASWTTNLRGCHTSGAWDHQSMVSAVPRPGVTTLGYPNVLVQCVNAVANALCGRSLDGGLTWVNTAPAFTSTACVGAGLHGHLKASPTGIIYLPFDACGRTYVSVSMDSGLTWTTRLVSSIATQAWSDPTVAVDAAGNVYAAFVDEWGHIWLSRSTNQGTTWSAAVQVSPTGVTGHMPALAAGAAGNVIVAYPGTPDMPNGYQSTNAQRQAAKWHAYVTGTTDAMATFSTAVANPLTDPLVKGPCGPARCPGMTDFIDVIIAPDGRAQAAFVDACKGTCATSTANNNASEAVLVTVDSPLFS